MPRTFRSAKVDKNGRPLVDITETVIFKKHTARLVQVRNTMRKVVLTMFSPSTVISIQS